MAEKKVDQSVKARTCANGKPQRQWSDKEEKSSPAASTASAFLTLMIEAKENRDVATVDVPNAFIQTDQPKGKDRERESGNEGSRTSRQPEYRGKTVCPTP